MNVAIFFKANFGKLIEGLVNGGAEHQPLGYGALVQNFFELFVKTTILKEMISFVENNHLDPS